MAMVNLNDAIARFSELLDRVQQGERFTIARRGRPVAMLVPAHAVSADISNLVEEMLGARDAAGPKLGKRVSIRQLVERGRHH